MIDEREGRPSSLRPETLRARIRWILFARVVIVTLFLAAVAISGLSGAGESEAAVLGPSGLIVVAYAVSLASAVLLPRTRFLEAFAYGQIFFDVALITLGIFLTGRLSSPMGVWYNLAILGAATTQLRRGAYTTATVSAVVYGVLMNFFYHGTIEALVGADAPVVPEGFELVYQVAANIASFFSIAFLSSLLVERVAITESALERTEESLQRVEAVQKALVQTLETGILSADTLGVIQSVNQAVETILGRPPHEIVGRKVEDVLPALRMRSGAGAIVGSSVAPIELSYRPGGAENRSAREERTLRLRTAIISDTFQNPVGRLYTVQDVTAVKQLEERLLADEEGAFADLPPSPPPSLTGLVGEGPRIREVNDLIHRVARSTATVLITGESGTGKELAARALHSLSERSEGPFVVVNCGAIPENLIESELFGHVRGAYSGAVASRSGLFRTADGGTIFLDEIGELPLALQPKLLRVLQERAFTPVGADSRVAVDVRIVAATNRKLEVEVAGRRFREDLFYRLNVIRIDMPPLRERREDLPVLVRAMVTRFGDSFDKRLEGVSAGAMARIVSGEYPGNVRELENVIEHAAALAEGDRIEESDLPASFGERRAKVATAEETTTATDLEGMRARRQNLDERLEETERGLIQEALAEAGGVRKRAAEILGINYRSLRHRLAKYEIDKSSE